MVKDRKNAKIEEGREKFAVKGDVTRKAVSGSQTSEMEAELLSADVDDRRVTEDAPIAGSDFTRKATEVSTKSEASLRWMRKTIGFRASKELRKLPP